VRDRPRNIILTGFMGTGKSSIGRRLARRLAWRFVDTDNLIEERAGQPIAAIFAEAGEAAFRAIEREVAHDVGSLRRHVVATGGGMVVDPENLELLEQAGLVILLEATVETIWERTRGRKHRPLLNNDDPRGTIERLLAARRAAYERVAHRLATDGRTPDEVVAEILKLYEGAAA